jgi:RNA polymerase sigma-70 factor (ECF subfamily)
MGVASASRAAQIVEIQAAPLVELARAGDQSAFADLMTPLLQPGFALAASLSPDRAAAEDALQEALLKAWRRLRQLHDGGKLRSWFLGIVFNECRVARRKRWRAIRRDSNSVGRGPDSWPEGLDERVDLRRALAALKSDDRAVLAVRFLLDMSVEESAEILRVSPAAVKSRTMRAAARLRRQLDIEG